MVIIMEDNNRRHDVVPFPQSLTGYIIGQNGRSINDIARCTGARVWVASTPAVHYREEWCYFHATGTDRQVDAAKCQLMLRIMHALQPNDNRT